MTQDGFIPLGIAVLTVSDSRTPDTDESGRALVELLLAAGHRLASRDLLPDDAARIEKRLRRWVEDPGVDVVLTTGGTGITGRDVTPEAVRRVLDKEIEGFGELFRHLSYAKIGAATIQSRALGGTAKGTYIFALPGSPGACRDAWEGILASQLDARTRPCNFAKLLPRLAEGRHI
jgi:molybdenum cofactor biosynthesis protein B